jgi:hypothetical protein
MPFSLDSLVGDWKKLLADWSSSGALARAASEALLLKAEPEPLKTLVSQWSNGDFSDLPPIVLLPSSSMPGAAGAYAISTGTIYLNQDWLAEASEAQAMAVLTEELGHHLDGLLKGVDTPGDEGKRFAETLGLNLVGNSSSNDAGVVLAGSAVISVEQAAVSIPAASPGRTSGEYKNEYAFAAIKADGSVVTWGDASLGGDSSAVASQLRSGVNQIFSTREAFAALKADGSVVTWGNSYSGGDSSAVESQLRSGVRQIFSTTNAFAALKADGSVVTWGDSYSGGDSSAVESQLRTGVRQIFSTREAFAALKADGSVVTWGNKYNGADSSAVASQLSSGVSKIYSTGFAFAALKTNGSVVTWGYEMYGGDSSAAANRLSSGVSNIYSTRSAFAAVKTDGSVVTWGYEMHGGDSSTVASQLRSNVKQIYSTNTAFAALKADSSVVTWGAYLYGGDSSSVTGNISSGVSQIFSSNGAFAALKTDGSVVNWGSGNTTGVGSSVSSKLSSGVKQIFSATAAFAALKTDGSVVTWGIGNTGYGGDSSAVASQLSSGVSKIYSTSSAFAALKTDGSVVTWGSGSARGSSAVASNLRSDVVGFADPFTNDWLLTPSLTQIEPVTLSVSQTTVTENGTANLVYTFVRTGPTTSTLIVNYSIAGTADTADYTGATPGTGKNITIPSGSAIATLTIDPTTDSTIEADETVALTLASGTGYTVGTTTAVVGTISNDNLPSINLAVSPQTVAEDDTTNLVYFFTRTGPTTSDLTVNYGITGTADSSDYTGATRGTAKTMSFAPGAQTTLLTIDPTADTTIEIDETVELTLSAGTGYTIGTTTPVRGTISNDDYDIRVTRVQGVRNTYVFDGRASTLDVTFSDGSEDRFYWHVESSYTSPYHNALRSWINENGLPVNTQPTEIRLSSSTFNENIASGTAIAIMDTSDPDSEEKFNYTLVAGTGSSDNDAFSIAGNQLKINASPDFETKSSYTIRIRSMDRSGLYFEKSITLNVNDIQEGSTSPTPIPRNPSAPLDLQPGRTCSLPGLRDYDGILHGGAPDSRKDSIAADYRFQGLFSLRRDGIKQAVFTNRSSGRWASAAFDPITRQIDYADNGKGGITRVIGIYIDILVAEGESNNGFLRNGEVAPKRGGPNDSQRRFQNDLLIDNLSARLAGDFDGDGIQELYWKVNDGTAYLRSLLHDDGNIRYANYQSRDQTTSYLTSNGHADLIASVL